MSEPVPFPLETLRPEVLAIVRDAIAFGCTQEFRLVVGGCGDDKSSTTVLILRGVPRALLDRFAETLAEDGSDPVAVVPLDRTDVPKRWRDVPRELVLDLLEFLSREPSERVRLALDAAKRKNAIPPAWLDDGVILEASRQGLITLEPIKKGAQKLGDMIGTDGKGHLARRCLTDAGRAILRLERGAR